MPRGHASHYRLLLEKLVSLPHLSMDPKARLRMAGRAKTEFLFKWRLRFTASPKAAPIFCVFGVVLLLYWGMQNLVIAVRSVRWTHPSQWDPSVAQHASLMGRECGELGCFLLVATFHERPAHWEKAHDTTKTKATQLIRNLPWIIYTRDLWQWMVKSIWKYCRISRFPRFPEQSWHFLTMAINQSQSDCDKLCIWIKWKQSPLQQLMSSVTWFLFRPNAPLLQLAVLPRGLPVAEPSTGEWEQKSFALCVSETSEFQYRKTQEMLLAWKGLSQHSSRDTDAETWIIHASPRYISDI